MTEPTVEVTVLEEPVIVTIGDNTPTVTITDDNTGVISVFNANPVATVIEESPVELTVLLNGGRPNPRIVLSDLPDILSVLTGAITLTQLSPNLVSLLQSYSDGLDGLSTLQASFALADLQITENSLSIGFTNDTVAANSLWTETKFSITDTAIDLHATSIQQLETGSVEHTGSFHVGFEEIEAIVSSVEITAAGIEQAQSGLLIHDDAIALFSITTDGLGTRIDATDADFNILDLALRAVQDAAVIKYAAIDVNSDNITSQVIEIDGINNEIASVNNELTAHSATLTVQSSNITGLDSTMTAIRTMMDNSWGVEIVQDGINGNYATGFGITLYENWDYTDEPYAIGDRVWFLDTLYVCILGHTSDLNKSPDEVGSLYWDVDPIGVKSNFAVRADRFEVRNDVGGDAVAPFVITDGVVNVNSALVVNVTSIQGAVDGGLDTTDGGIIVRDPVSNDYAQLTDGDLNFWYSDGIGGHTLYNSVRRIETGVANNGSLVTIPGIFNNEPTVSLSINSIGVYKASYPTSDQVMVISTGSIIETSPGSKVWTFTPTATLNLATGLATNSYTNISTGYVASSSVPTYFSGTSIGSPPNTINIAASGNVSGSLEWLNSNREQYTYVYLVIDGVRHQVGYKLMADAYGTTFDVAWSGNVNVAAGAHTYYLEVAVWGLRGPDGCNILGVTMYNASITTTVDAASILMTGSVNYIAIGD
jgi:hypothetical protein